MNYINILFIKQNINHMGNSIFKRKSARVSHYQQTNIIQQNQITFTDSEETNLKDSDNYCPICFETIDNNYKTYCCHQKIHKQCLEDCYNITNHTCPLCRTNSLAKNNLIKFYINIRKIRHNRRLNYDRDFLSMFDDETERFEHNFQNIINNY